MTDESRRVFLTFSGSFLGVLVVVVLVNLALVSRGDGRVPYESHEGYRLMLRYGCPSCHRLGGKGSHVGPALDGVGQRHDRRWLEAWIRSPWSIKPGSPMPTLRLPEDDLRKVVDFLITLEAPPDSARNPGP